MSSATPAICRSCLIEGPVLCRCVRRASGPVDGPYPACDRLSQCRHLLEPWRGLSRPFEVELQPNSVRSTSTRNPGWPGGGAHPAVASGGSWLRSATFVNAGLSLAHPVILIVGKTRCPCRVRLCGRRLAGNQAWILAPEVPSHLLSLPLAALGDQQYARSPFPPIRLHRVDQLRRPGTGDSLDRAC